MKNKGVYSNIFRGNSIIDTNIAKLELIFNEIEVNDFYLYINEKIIDFLNKHNYINVTPISLLSRDLLIKNDIIKDYNFMLSYNDNKHDEYLPILTNHKLNNIEYDLIKSIKNNVESINILNINSLRKIINKKSTFLVSAELYYIINNKNDNVIKNHFLNENEIIEIYDFGINYDVNYFMAINNGKIYKNYLINNINKINIYNIIDIPNIGREDWIYSLYLFEKNIL